jgi:hypothetical protein
MVTIIEIYSVKPDLIEKCTSVLRVAVLASAAGLPWRLYGECDGIRPPLGGGGGGGRTSLAAAALGLASSFFARAVAESALGTF